MRTKQEGGKRPFQLTSGPGRLPLDGRTGGSGDGLAAEAEDALDVAGQAALALLLHLVVERRERHVVEGQVEEQGLAGDGLEARGEVHQVGLLAHQGRVQPEGLQSVAQRLRKNGEERMAGK